MLIKNGGFMEVWRRFRAGNGLSKIIQQVHRDKKLTYEQRHKYLSFKKNVHIDEKTTKNLRISHVAGCNENTYQKP